MKYNPTMKSYWKDIADTVQRMTTPHQLDYVKKLAEDSDSRKLLDWLKDNFGKPKIKGYGFECTPQNLKILYDHKINNSGDDYLTLTWADLTAFVLGKKDLVFDKSAEVEEGTDQNGKEATDNIPKIGSYVEEDMLGDELTFDEIADMVGEIIVYDHSTESRAWYKVVKIEEIIDGSDGKRHLRFYDGSKQRGTVNEIFFDKSQRRPQRAWRLKKAQASDCPCDNCIHDDKGCCDYPDTQDDYCVCGDKQVPVTSEDNSLAFDYSELDNDTATRLHKCETVIRTETAGYFTLLGAKFKEAQELLANHSTGTFEKWYTALGFKRQTVYNLIRRFEFSSSPTIGGHEEAFEALPLTLSYEISKADAPPELVEKVLDGDITTNAEYQRLKNEMERLQKRLAEETARADRNASERIDLQEQKRKLEQENKDLDQRLDDEVKYSYELQEQIEQLQNQPVDVAVIDNSDELAEKDSEIAELKEEIERLSDKNIKNFVIKLSVEQFDVLLKLVKDCEDTAVRMAVQKAQLLRV